MALTSMESALVEARNRVANGTLMVDNVLLLLKCATTVRHLFLCLWDG